MKSHKLGRSGIVSSRLVYGCMRIVGDGSRHDRDRGLRALRAAVDEGYTQFDHADIYADGASETLFGDFLRESPDIRQRILITGKCGIRKAGEPTADSPGRYDFSSGHILSSVDASLKRLGVEQLDLLLLHRPDYLFEPEVVAAVFETLHSAGKVDAFGVSNFSVSQVNLLQAATGFPLLVNQVEINLHNISALDDGTLDQCLQQGLTPQAWCPIAGVAYPAWGNTFGPEDDARIRQELARQQQIYAVEDWIIALAWLLRHPAKIQPIIGSTTPSRIAAAKKALEIDYGREDWYRLLEARNGQPVA